MSWIKKRNQTARSNSSAIPTVPIFNPNEHSNSQNQWQQQNFQAPAANWYPQNVNNPNEYPQQFYNNSQQYQQYWQQANQTSQQPQQHEQQQSPQQHLQNFNNYQYQNTAPYSHDSYGNYGNQGQHLIQPIQQQQQQPQQQQQQVQPQQQVQQVQPQQQMQQYQPQQQSELDSWNSWSWGEENNSNIQPAAGYQQINANQLQQQTPSSVSENLTNDETWNWSLEESSSSSSLQRNPLENDTSYSSQTLQSEENSREELFPKIGPAATKFKLSPSESENQNSQIVSGNVKQNKLATLNNQWSTESQISQDSSENNPTSDSNSRMLSRSSTNSESSLPLQEVGLNNEKINLFEASQERSRKISDSTLKNEPLKNFKQEDVSHHENVEIVASKNSPMSYPTPPPSTKSQANSTPPPMLKNNTPPLMPPLNSLDDFKNPYKRTTALSHRAINKSQAPQNLDFQQSVNLETVPDNSEQPDSYPLQSTQMVRKISNTKPPFPHYPDNNEMAPINDRNQYLETGQLSNSEIMIDNNDTLPPPGLQRMVLGQMEYNEENIALNDDVGDNQLDEPPPGLSRMVLGQNVNSENTNMKNKVQELNEPPVGFPRMVPGESSSPENTKWNIGQSKNRNGGSSNIQNQPSQTRSATIGADTPPASILPTSDNQISDISSVDSKNDRVSTEENKSSKTRERKGNKAHKNSENTRRTSIDGQQEDAEIANITTSVRDMTVGGPEPGLTEKPPRKPSIQQDSSDTDSKRDKVPTKNREHRDKNREREKSRRYRDEENDYERNKEKGKRYSPSPDRYRDKKYDRRKYRDRREEDETDYNSDKEHRDRRRDYRDKYEDYKKYNSLKKDKYKEKQRRDTRDGNKDSKRGEYYYGRYEDDYDDPTRSRPSSRSDSMHESYREKAHGRDRQRGKERDRHRRPVGFQDMYMQMQGYPYDPYNPYYQQLQYQYYENLRRTSPRTYEEIYRKYYQKSGGQNVYGDEERASVHSGRSSANDELSKDRYTRQSFYSQSSYPHVGDYYREAHSISGHYGQNDVRMYDRIDSSLNLEETVAASQRLTPAKFTTAHIKASISSGVFIKVLPHYPLDGQSATVEIGGFQDYLLYDDEYRELSQFPGPLVRGITHKKTVIEYCENKIKNSITIEDVDTDSYVLMWELMILLLRQNGMVVGTDIAELLMKDRKHETNRRPSIASNASSSAPDRTDSLNNLNSDFNSGPALKEEIVTNKFREYLLYGSGKEALEWAMKHGLWGHALFLASKLDKRTYANVMTRFANGLPINDPLQTLYQLLSGKIPSAVTSVADEKWGDWRPHLAMILSNTSQRPDLDRKAITTLADTLLSRGNVYAAHFCYLMAQVGFGRYGTESAKIVLLGSNHSRPFFQFANNEAIHLTEIYEYACSLNDSSFVIPEFQTFKYLLATRLTDRGFLEKGLTYMEGIATVILQSPNEYQPSLISNVCRLGDRLKYCEPVVDDSDADVVDYNLTRADSSWLRNLKSIEENFNLGHVKSQTLTELPTNEYVESQDVYQQQQQQQQQYQQMQQPQQSFQYGGEQDSWQQHQHQQQQQQLQMSEQLGQDDNQQQYEVKDVYGNQQYSDQQQHWQNQQQIWQQQQQQFNQHSNDYQQVQQQNNLWSSAQAEPVEEVKNERDTDVQLPQISMPNQSKGGRGAIFEDEENEQKVAPNAVLDKTKPASNILSGEKQNTTGWFGGIWNRLSLKPKNQMKLPDDKNPTIVWDETKKRWVNVNEDGDVGSHELKPPPKMSDMMTKKPVTPAPIPPTYNDQSSMDNQNSNPNQSAAIWNSYNANNNNNQANPNIRPSSVEDNNVVAKSPSQPNMFKLQRGRNIKKSYVDVFNPGSKTSSSIAAQDSFNANLNSYNNNNSTPQMNFFIPAPVNDPNAPVDFLTPAPSVLPQQSEVSQISRWSSTSSLSREVQSYTSKKPQH